MMSNDHPHILPSTRDTLTPTSSAPGVHGTQPSLNRTGLCAVTRETTCPSCQLARQFYPTAAEPLALLWSNEVFPTRWAPAAATSAKDTIVPPEWSASDEKSFNPWTWHIESILQIRCDGDIAAAPRDAMSAAAISSSWSAVSLESKWQTLDTKSRNGVQPFRLSNERASPSPSISPKISIFLARLTQ